MHWKLHEIKVEKRSTIHIPITQLIQLIPIKVFLFYFKRWNIANFQK